MGSGQSLFDLTLPLPGRVYPDRALALYVGPTQRGRIVEVLSNLRIRALGALIQCGYDFHPTILSAFDIRHGA
eukprot:7972069-Pyramimonas_sp.AAC.1